MRQRRRLGQQPERAGYACGFDILSGAGTTPKWGLTLGWAEVELDLES